MSDTSLVEPEDVVVIINDLLRAYTMSFVGYDRESTPFLDSYSHCFANAISTSPKMSSSMPSILTGLYPHSHGAVLTNEYRNFDEGIPMTQMSEDVYTLPELLGAKGYAPNSRRQFRQSL